MEVTVILPPHQRVPRSQPHAPTDFARQVLEGLPLAHASLALFAYGVPDPVLADLYERHRGRGYEDVVTFAQLVTWIFDALIEHQGSGRQAHLRRHRQPDDGCHEAFYGKLRRIPRGLSEAFLRDVTDRFTALFPEVVAHRLPTSFDRLEVLILDGKSLKKVAKRLVDTRGTPGKLLGGKLLVAYRPRDGLVLDMAADLDGETNEAKLIPDLMPRVHARGGPAKLVVGDRLFCASKHFAEFTKDNGHFVVRYARTLSFEPDPKRPAVTTADPSQRAVVEEWGWAGKPKDKLRRYVRRITVARPVGEAITILTDLLDSAPYPATDLLDLYRIRWTIEGTFQKVTAIFALGRFIGSTPEATVFQASMCFVLANVVQVLQGYVVAKRKVTIDDLSTAQFCTDWHRQLAALKELVEVSMIVSLIPTDQTAESVGTLLDQLLGTMWKPGWDKTRNKAPRAHPHAAKQKGAHTSVQRRRQAHKPNEDP
ncbi:IS4/IS5 family transposase [Gemmata obscuriglobus]|uniref:IS4/IS5 family transposase n=1 Tax=Gemmata obscuriglobus TaxID=114 RepID=A0A2Z3H0K4_9BACT|nr:IS4/IS5 family transposase [Gemmata obscuriglobus]AWM36211.1 IS4/IS5 family transposase [Gemmata obscuriglobus]AWM36999.1 IS4/IS5 family transposase [Gemmata obscuriglobus]AWM37422.1 IS4/IS5 family transposase [Gemmata obscuriglobus]AWM37514.1 IS4/IS5 family transposase [Gemmata obscuriglobus]